jgi:anti-sigma factor RsiW
MTCSDVAGLLDAFIDAELPGPTLLAIARHAGGCPACDAALREATALHETVERVLAAEGETLDLAGVWPAVAERIDRADARAAWRRRVRAAPVWAGAGLAAAAVLAALWLRPGRTPDQMVRHVAPRANNAVIERLNTGGGRFEIRRERKYGTTAIMVSADASEVGR